MSVFGQARHHSTSAMSSVKASSPKTDISWSNSVYSTFDKTPIMFITSHQW